MKAKITKHQDRITVLANKSEDTIRLGTLLRTAIGADNVLSVNGGYLVSHDAVPFLARILPPEGNEWDPELNSRVLQIRAAAQNQSNARLEVAQALEAPYYALKDYDSVWRLDPHQVEAVAAMTVPSLQGMALFDEQGVGKTICALAAFDILRQRGLISHLFVVAPKSVLSVWKNETNTFFGDRYSVTVIGGKRSEQLKLLDGDHDVLFMSYEAVSRSSVIMQGLASTKGRKFMLVVDESYYVKNPQSLRSRSMSQLRQWCKRAYVLCGTPAPNSPTDVVHQIDIADAGMTFGGISVPRDDDLAAVIVKEALGNSAIYLRRLKEEVFPLLPSKTTEKIYVGLQSLQSHMYEDALHNLIIDVRQVDDTYFMKHLGKFMARKWALLQICSNPGVFDPLYTEAPAKLLALDQIVKSIVEEQGRKIVIWSFFRYSLQAIVSRYSNYGIVKIDGSVDSVEERTLAIQRFQEDPAISIFVGNPAAAGSGITLTAASHAVYESFSNQPAHYLQSVDRIHRRGQHNPVISFVLIAQPTIEERDFDKLMEKEQRGHELFGKQPAESVTREGFLKDLIGE